MCSSQSFDAEPHLRLLREMLRQLFATPVKHHKSKPFVDHVISFYVADGRIWLRNYQARQGCMSVVTWILMDQMRGDAGIGVQLARETIHMPL